MEDIDRPTHCSKCGREDISEDMDLYWDDTQEVDVMGGIYILECDECRKRFVEKVLGGKSI